MLALASISKNEKTPFNFFYSFFFCDRWWVFYRYPIGYHGTKLFLKKSLKIH
jgi:hypothetical protein